MILAILSSIILSNLLEYHLTFAQSYLPKSDCVKLCYDYRKNQLNKQICNPTVAIAPKPATYKSCLHGLHMGFEHACVVSCSGESYKEESGVQPGNSFEACKSEGKNSKAMDWCRHAYDVTFKITPTMIQTEVQKQFQNTTQISHRILSVNDDDDEKLGSIVSPVEDVDTIPASVHFLENDDDIQGVPNNVMTSINMNEVDIVSNSEVTLISPTIEESNLQTYDVIQPETIHAATMNQLTKEDYSEDEMSYPVFSSHVDFEDGQLDMEESLDDYDQPSYVYVEEENEDMAAVNDFNME